MSCAVWLKPCCKNIAPVVIYGAPSGAYRRVATSQVQCHFVATAEPSGVCLTAREEDHNRPMRVANCGGVGPTGLCLGCMHACALRIKSPQKKGLLHARQEVMCLLLDVHSVPIVSGVPPGALSGIGGC